MNLLGYNTLRNNWVEAERTFRKLKDLKKINRKQKKQIENKLRALSYIVWLNDPKIKNLQFKQEIFLDFLTYLNNKFRKENTYVRLSNDKFNDELADELKSKLKEKTNEN